MKPNKKMGKEEQNPLTNHPKVCEDIGMDIAHTEVTIRTGDLVTIPDAAKQLGVNFSTVYRWIEKGKVIPFRIGKQAFITTQDLNTLKERRAQEK